MSKRKRTEVTAVHKKKLCVWKQDHPRASLEDMRQYAESDLQLKIGKSTCGDIWKSRDKWSAADPSSPSGSRLRTPANHQLESALVLWLSDVVSRGASVSDAMLVEKAEQFGKDLGVTDLTYSRGWLARMKKRHGLMSHTYHGEAASENQAIILQGRADLQDVLSAYDLADIYNMDETGLFYRCVVLSF